MSEHDLKRISERYFALWEAHDPDGIAAMHAEDSRFQTRIGTEPAVGREAIRETFAGYFARFPEFGFDTHRVLYGDGFWVLDWRLTFLPEGATERRGFDCNDVVTVNADGLVARKDTFIDMVGLQAALPELDVAEEVAAA